MKKKAFLITIDTEGDDQWNWHPGNTIFTENAKYIPRFQNLCERFGFKPVYLTNYEMANDNYFVDFAKDVLKSQNCEIGMHLHAWNSPPDWELILSGKKSGAPYLIEYPEKIMDEKIKVLTYILEDTFGEKMISHRAGRWATNSIYIKILAKYGYKIDCSVTPGVNWSNAPGITDDSCGSDYQESPSTIHRPYNDNIIEIPMTIRKVHYPSRPANHSIKNWAGMLKNSIWGRNIWLRPTSNNLNDMLRLIDLIQNDKNDYVMFMLHSSELMPGGSPNFVTEKEIENLYYSLNTIFNSIQKFSYGSTLKEYLESRSLNEGRNSDFSRYQ